MAHSSSYPIELSIVPLDEIIPHEDTIPSLVRDVERELRGSACQRDPILIDKTTHLALDGTHRRKALARVGAKYAVCSAYDYYDPSIKLERWLRYLVSPTRKVVKCIIPILGLERSSDPRTALKMVDSGKSTVAFVSKEFAYVSRSSGKQSKLEVYENLRKIDRICKRNKTDFSVAADSERYELISSPSTYVIYPQRLSKQDVIKMAEDGRAFPYKTTRHIVSLRPMGICFPLDYLQKKSALDCIQKLEQIVNFSKVQVKRRNIWYEGRRYPEKLAVFRHPKPIN